MTLWYVEGTIKVKKLSFVWRIYLLWHSISRRVWIVSCHGNCMAEVLWSDTVFPFTVLTSNAGIPSAALYFTTGALGHYGMCVSSKGPVDESTTKPIFTGKFCSLYFTSPSGPLNWAWNIIKENGDVHVSTLLLLPFDNHYYYLYLKFALLLLLFVLPM